MHGVFDDSLGRVRPIMKEDHSAPVPESKSITSKLDFNSSIAGTKLDRCIPFLYKSSG